MTCYMTVGLFQAKWFYNLYACCRTGGENTSPKNMVW